MKVQTTLAEAFEQICGMDAPLSARLFAYTEKLRELNFPFAEAYDDLVARLYAGEVGRAAPTVGEQMPAFMLPSQDGKLVALQDLLGNGPIVVSFNRGHWCPFCKIELRAIAAFHAELESAGAQAISITPDKQQFFDDLREKTGHFIRILTDVDNGYALSLGLVIWVGETVKRLMKGRGFELNSFQGNDGWYVPIPATYVLDRTGKIIGRHVDPDFRKRMEVSEILELVHNASVDR